MSTTGGGAVYRGWRAVTVVYGSVMALNGLWAAAAPASFHRDFPIPGAAWVSTLGPYDEHLVRDFGGALVALSLLGVWLGIQSGRREIRAVAVVWTLAAALHVGFHLTTFDRFSTGSAIAQGLGLALSLIVPAVLWVGTRPLEPVSMGEI